VLVARPIETSDVTKLEIVKLEVGQRVSFTADALSEVAMNGVVTDEPVD